MSDQPQIAVLASGNGSLFQGIAEASLVGKLNANLVGLIVSRSTAYAVERAAGLNIPCVVIDKKSFSGTDKWDLALLKGLQKWSVDFVVLAGYMQKIGPRVLNAYSGRIVNTHPSLLPRHGGKGMYGTRVHEAVIAANDATTGISVHLVNENYDDGPILDQLKVDVFKSDTIESLESRVKAVEKEFYLQVLASFFKSQTSK